MRTVKEKEVSSKAIHESVEKIPTIKELESICWLMARELISVILENKGGVD